MKTVYKYPLVVETENLIAVPGGNPLQVVHVGPDPSGQLCLWAVADTEKQPVRRKVLVLGTGHEIPAGSGHIGSVLSSPFVWHVFLEISDTEALGSLWGGGFGDRMVL